VDVFVARQPIFDRQWRVYGYELLYRSSQSDNKFDGTDSATATKQVISNTLLSIGLENIACGKKAFLNFDRSLLNEGIYLSLPREVTVIEILESVEPTVDLIELCKAIHGQGYAIALDDFVPSAKFEPLTRLAQLIKVDTRLTDRAEQERLLQTYRPRGIALLAEKIETHEEFEWARAAGYDYFQGYFFARPNVMQSHQIPASKLNCLRLLSEVQHADLNFERVKDLIASDVSLTYKLLRYANSALFGRHDEIKSIGHALANVGADNIRRWVALAALPMLATDKPGELVRLSIVRARFCESLVQRAGITLRNEAFLMGMFSLLDALLDQPLEDALRAVSLRPVITQALLGTAPDRNPLATIYKLTRRYELGDWDEVEALAQACGFPALAAGNAYTEAAFWAERMLHPSDD
jgi:c-di-GMP-related signal transduction protein